MIRRVFMSTINFDHPQKGMEHAFGGIFGPRVATFDYLQLERMGMSKDQINEEFAHAVIEYRPDWLWLQAQDTDIIQGDTLLRIREKLPKCVLSHWAGDMRATVSPYLQSICKATHLTTASSFTQLPLFREAGAQRAEYLQIGLDWAEDVMGEPDWIPPFRVPEIVFCGNYYGTSFPEGTKTREGAIRALQEAGLDVGIVGSGWPSDFPTVGSCGVKQQHHVWKRAKICLSVNHFDQMERYYSDRQLIAMASGTPVLCQYVPGLQKEFDDGHDLLWFVDEKIMVEQAMILLNCPEKAKRIGLAGRARVLRDHTWFSRILGILPVVEEIARGL